MRRPPRGLVAGRAHGIHRVDGLRSEVTGPESRRGPDGVRIPVGYQPDAPARLRSPTEGTGPADPLAGASGWSAGGVNGPSDAQRRPILWTGAAAMGGIGDPELNRTE